MLAVFLDKLNKRFAEFFENPRDITIYGGIFNAGTYNPVVHANDPVVREVREQNVCSFPFLSDQIAPNSCL